MERVGAKKGTPPEIISYLEDAFTKALQTKKYQEFTEKTFTNLRPGYMSSKEALKPWMTILPSFPRS